MNSCLYRFHAKVEKFPQLNPFNSCKRLYLKHNYSIYFSTNQIGGNAGPSNCFVVTHLWMSVSPCQAALSNPSHYIRKGV